MCLSTSLSLAMSPGPAAARMRHWSCPERLGLELDSDLAEDSAQLCGRGAARCGEAEDVFSRVDLRVRVLAAWEERVLSLRQARRSKQRPEAESCGPAPSDPPRRAAADAGLTTSRTPEPRDPASARPLGSSRPAPEVVTTSVNLSAEVAAVTPPTRPPDPAPSPEHGDPRPSCSEAAPLAARQRETRLEKQISCRLRPPAAPRSLSSSGPEARVPQDEVTHPPSSRSVQQQTCSYTTTTATTTRAATTQQTSSYPAHRSPLAAWLLLPALLNICSLGLASLGLASRPQSRKGPPDKARPRGRDLQRRLLGLGCWLGLAWLATPAAGLGVDQHFLADMSAGPGEAGPVCGDGVFKGNININNKDEETGMSSLARYENCSVVEGSISITSAVYEMTGFGNYSMPNLVEVTDFVLLYRANEIDSLENLFPRLAVIRGHKLVQFYALAIYQMKNMVRVGLPSLTHIMNGGVRIEKNPLLCYVDTVRWRQIVVQQNDRESHIEIIDNQETNSCLDRCPAKCEDTGCWSSADCQRVIVPCPEGTQFSGQRMCYRDNRGDEGRPCHQECVGGCGQEEADINSAAACTACNHTRNRSPDDPRSFTCTSHCPGSLVAYKKWMCITEEECCQRQVFEFPMSLSSEVYKVHGDQCVDKCPSGFKPVQGRGAIWRCERCRHGDCPRHCDGEIVSSPESARKLQSCTHINGDLVINVNRGDITNLLEEYLQHIEEISGSLKIERSHSLVSLHFFKSLRKIGGDLAPGLAQKTLTIFENDNLQMLFPDNQVLDLGAKRVVFIHYNQKLCMKEITKFLEKSGVGKQEEHSVSHFSNGNKIVCSEEKLDLVVITGGPDLLKLQYKNYYQVLEGLDDVDVTSLLGYHVYYREVTEEQFRERSITKYEGMDACGGSAWKTIFEEDPSKFSGQVLANDSNPCDPKREKCFHIGNGNYVRIVYNDVSTYLPNCKPYTPYAIYVTTVMEKSLAGRATGAQSDIVYARTNETNPSPVAKLSAKSPSPNTLEVSWNPPSNPNGVIDQYFLEISYLQTGNDAEERDYCDQRKQTADKAKVPAEPAAPTPPEDTDGTCPVCEACGAGEDSSPSKPVAPKTDKVIAEKSFHDDIINKVFPLIQSVAVSEEILTWADPYSRRKRSVAAESPDNSLAANTSQPLKLAANETFISIQSQRNGPIKQLSEANRSIADTGYMARVVVTLPGDTTAVTLHQLRHYTDYEVRVLACHQLRAAPDPGGREYRACSDEAILNTKTSHNKTADSILPWSEDYDLYTQSGNGSEGIIKWFPPPDPNERIVNYMLSRSPDASSSNAFIKCISLKDIKRSRETVLGEERDVMSYTLTDDGEYYIRLQAVSLFDEGSWTKFQFVRVNSNKSGVVLVVVLLFFALLLAGMVTFGAYAYYRKKKSPGGWTISSINDNYIDSREIYVVDDWEVKREDTKLLEELGKGSFGMVYRGIYTHPDKGEMPCAVKTVNEKSSYRQKIEFLQEASVMKDYNTEHVIKLIGVVSEGQPALVLMELMENGDLKNYLRNLRPDSENNRRSLPAPTLADVLQMALDIADGMSYLSVKKIVHRDLAARNCMVSSSVVVKVGDFGMARDIYETEYYRKQGRGLLPVRWMAPESIKDGKFTSQSDVWSFGVVLWEMSTLAEQPYQGFTNDEVMKYVKDGNKMRRPDSCPDILHELMSACWALLPDERPTFLQICARLLDSATPRWRDTCYFLTPEGREAVTNQEEMFQLRREQEEAAAADASTPLTEAAGHNGSSNGGHLANTSLAGESHPLVNIRPHARSPTQVHFSNESGYSGSVGGSRSGSRGRLSMNGIVARIRNMSGSAGAALTLPSAEPAT